MADYALGVPGGPIRTWITGTAAIADINRLDGEVAIAVDEKTPGSISPDGLAIGAPLPLSLDELKLEKWVAAKAFRDSVIDGGHDVPGIGRFDTDPVSRGNINGAVTGAMVAQMTGAPFAVPWKLADNSVVMVPDAATMIAIGVDVLAFVSACHAHSQALGLSIEAAADEAALDAIDTEDGWPS